MSTPGCVIDVSHWQGAVDWPQVFDSGILHAFLKCTQGLGYADPTYLANRGGAGLVRPMRLPRMLWRSEPRYSV
jgi:GH25 family lysozyme M1 (1,4-beta-N-acetylmuramidase)